MNGTSRLRVNLLATWGDYAMGVLVCLVLMPFVLHTLGDETYGVWLFINSIAGYSGLLNLGFGETISRYVATYHARKENERLNQVVNGIGAVYASMGFVAALIAVLLALVAPRLHEWGGESLMEVRWVLVVLGLNTAIGITGSVFGGVLVGIQRFDIERGMILLSGIVRFFLTIFLLNERHGLLTLALIFLTITSVENAGYVLFAFRKVPTLAIGRRHLSWPVLKECFSFSGFAFLHNVAQRVIWATDSIVIGFILGAEAIVPYFIASRLSEFISRPVTCIGMVMMPRAGQLHANEDTERLQSLLTKGVGLAFVLMMGFFIGAGFFGKALIGVWVGPGYVQSHQLLLVLLGARIVSTPLEVIRSMLFGMGRVRVPALLYVAEAIGNLGLTLILIRPFGLMGVALGTAVPLVVIELGFLLPYALRQLHYGLERFFHRVLGPPLLPLAALLVYSTVVSRVFVDVGGWTELVSVAVGGGVVLAAVWFAFDWIDKRLRMEEACGG